MATSNILCTISWSIGETVLYLCLLCPFEANILRLLLAWEQFSLPSHFQVASYTSIADWWEAAVKTVPKEKKTKIQWPMHLRHVEFVERMKPEDIPK